MHPNRLLIIDDEPDVGRTIKAIAAGCGYDIKLTSDAVAFLDALATWKPTHIVLDLQMPVIDGIELLRTLGALRASAKIIIVSGVEGRVVEAGRLIGLERGLDIAATLLKPFRASELRHLLDQLAVREDWNSATALAEALGHGALFLVYVPKVELRSGRLAGFEALARWQHPRHGLLLPEQFVPLAQKTGMTDRLIDTMLELALAQLAEWTGKLDATLAINLSSRSIDDLAFADRLEQRCAARGVAPQRLVMELTESHAMADPLAAVDILARLRLKGFRLAMDDFGTGACSLTQLARLPFSELKIDGSFVRDAGGSGEARAIVRSMVELAHNLGMRAVAEGVETAALERMALDLDCDLAQGSHIGPPMPASAIPAWLDGWAALAAQHRQGALGATAPFRAAGDGRSYDGGEAMKALLTQALAERIEPFWGFGRTSLVGWRPADGGINVLLAPYATMVARQAANERLLHGRRLMGERTFQAVQQLCGAAPTYVPLPFSVADDMPGAVTTAAIEQLLRRYGITETRHRAVSLLDIVGFSRLEPAAQVAQLNSLECSINTAQAVMAQLGRQVDLARTTTGDGCYLWNREKGASADLGTYLLTMLVLADNAIARHRGRETFVPELRTCFSVGPHYSYGDERIVGDVTNGLAQMICKCLPGQILIGDFTRPTEDDDEPASPVDFVIKADGAFGRFDQVVLHGRAVRAIRSGAPDAGCLRLRGDGEPRLVFNQKFNIDLGRELAATAQVETLLLGLRQAELDAFEAEPAA